MRKISPDFFDALAGAVEPGEVLERVHEEEGSGKRRKDRAIIYRYQPPL